MNKNSFKDQCDICNKFDYLKSFDNKCLCSECYKELNIKNSQKIIKKEQKIIKKEQKQLNLFNFS